MGTMTLHQKLFLGLTVLCVAFQSTTAVRSHNVKIELEDDYDDTEKEAQEPSTPPEQLILTSTEVASISSDATTTMPHGGHHNVSSEQFLKESQPSNGTLSNVNRFNTAATREVHDGDSSSGISDITASLPETTSTQHMEESSLSTSLEPEINRGTSSQSYNQPRHHNTETSQSTPTEEHVVRIVVLGRSGSGISSTIRELIGPLTKCEKPEGTKETFQNIYEYTISNIPGTSFHIKLVDIPGFVDGRTPEQDAQILAILKSYYLGESSPPDIFLALSRFDDNDDHFGANADLVRFLNRIDLYNQVFIDQLNKRETKISPIFLFTRFMSETKYIQRKPANKIENFRRVIEEFSSLSPPYQIVVGDNNAKTEHNVDVDGGYYRLPNKEYYPKNVWEAMINASALNADAPGAQSQVQSTINAIMEHRETEMKCEVKLIETDWDENVSDFYAFLYLLQHQHNWTIRDTEINSKIQNAFKELPLNPDRREAVVMKTALQLYLQNGNITALEDIPSSYADRAAFLQNSSLTSSTYPALLLNSAFGLKMPEYILPLTVGYGYDVLADELSLETPFNTAESRPSPVGYQLPKFMKCRRFSVPPSPTFSSYSQNISDYFVERLKHLKFTREENITNVGFTGRAKGGFNIAPEEGVEIVTLSAIKEIRTLKCVLAKKQNWGELNEEFVETINGLSKVDLYNKDSITDWKVFFARYGTHLVSEGYGGGMLLGSMVGTNLRRALESRSTIRDTLESILTFSNFIVPDLEMPSYGLFGGEVGESNTQINQLYSLPEEKREQILSEWGRSLNSNFDMLKNEFTLERISTVVREKIGVEKGEMMDEAISLLLRGELVRKRKRGQVSTGNRKGGNRGNTRQRPPTTTQPSSKPSQEENGPIISNHTQSTGIGLEPTSSTQASLPQRYNSFTDSSAPPLLPSFNGSSDDVVAVMKAQAQSSNFTLHLLHQKVADTKKKNALLHEQELEAEQRHYREQLEVTERKKNMTLSLLQKRNETEYTQFQDTLKSIREQGEMERTHMQVMFENLKRENEEAERRHQLLMEQLVKQQEEAARQERCSGWSFHSVTAEECRNPPSGRNDDRGNTDHRRGQNRHHSWSETGNAPNQNHPYPTAPLKTSADGREMPFEESNSSLPTSDRQYEYYYRE